MMMNSLNISVRNLRRGRLNSKLSTLQQPVSSLAIRQTVPAASCELQMNIALFGACRVPLQVAPNFAWTKPMKDRNPRPWPRSFAIFLGLPVASLEHWTVWPAVETAMSVSAKGDHRYPYERPIESHVQTVVSYLCLCRVPSPTASPASQQWLS